MVEAVPESAGVIAAELINNLSEDLAIASSAEDDSDMARAHQLAINTDVAIDLVERLSKVAPDSTSDVAAATMLTMAGDAALDAGDLP